VLADDEQSFADAINRLIADDGFYRTVRNEGIVYFQERFSIDSCWKKLDEVFVADGGTGAQDRV
jgi:glycosyltransferase involved in cell wall biosynthesis